MDYLQGLDQKLLSAMSLVRPAKLTLNPISPQQLWTDCVAEPDPQNPCKQSPILSIDFHI